MPVHMGVGISTQAEARSARVARSGGAGDRPSGRTPSRSLAGLRLHAIRRSPFTESRPFAVIRHTVNRLYERGWHADVRTSTQQRHRCRVGRRRRAVPSCGSPKYWFEFHHGWPTHGQHLLEQRPVDPRVLFLFADGLGP